MMTKRRWTVSEDLWLTLAHNNGMTYRQIGKRLGRSEKSAMERYRNLLQIGFTSMTEQKPKNKKTEPSDRHDSKEDVFVIAPRTTEAKTKRVQLVMQPSLYDKVKHKSDSCDVSVNDFIHQVLEIATLGDNA